MIQNMGRAGNSVQSFSFIIIQREIEDRESKAFDLNCESIKENNDGGPHVSWLSRNVLEIWAKKK